MGRPPASLPARYGSRFFVEGVPDAAFPEQGMSARDAYELIEEEMALDGDPARNLATFVTTWMEPEAKEIVAENLHRNFIDHAEYPRTAEIEQRCLRMLGDLFNAPGEVKGARCQGSSEAIMLARLAAKWRWRNRLGAGVEGARPNLVYGRDVHVVWDKLCRYFDIEPRTVPLHPNQYTIGAEQVEPLIDENTIGGGRGAGDDLHRPRRRGRRDRRAARQAALGAWPGGAAARGRRQRWIRLAVPLPR
ncbi:MAG: pyridoxal-dependent decarboxylase [Solirubrobacterales bacterium]